MSWADFLISAAAFVALGGYFCITVWSAVVNGINEDTLISLGAIIVLSAGLVALRATILRRSGKRPGESGDSSDSGPPLKARPRCALIARPR